MVKTLCVLILSFTILLSSQECINNKVLISTDILEEILLIPYEADSKEFLWHVAILRQSEVETEFLCSGTVVGDSHVVTAASCVADVYLKELQVVSGLSRFRSSSNALNNPHSVFGVTRKYYPYHNRIDGLMKDDLAVLKLDSKTTFRTPQLAILEEIDKYSKHCFTLGWGVHNQSAEITQRCPNPSFHDSINSFLQHAEQNKPILSKLLDIRNFMGLSSTLIFQLTKMLDILPGLAHIEQNSKHSKDLTCTMDEFARIKAVRMSTKHPYKCSCRKANQICLYTIGEDDLAHQIDIGSPVFCRIKKPKSRNGHVKQDSNKFGLAGIITNKDTEEVPLLKYSSSINMMTAINVTNFSEFIFAVLHEKH